MSYIDTQGISGPPIKKGSTINKQHYSPMPVKKMSIFNDLERKELKEIFKEALSEYYTNDSSDEWLYRGTY